MRQILDKIYTYKGTGTFFEPVPTPSALIQQAIVDFILASTRETPAVGGEQRVDKAGDLVTRTPLVGRPRGHRPDLVVGAIDRAHELLKNIGHLIAVNRVIFQGGNMDYVWRGRNFMATREALYDALHLSSRTRGRAGSSARTTAQVVAATTPDERRLLAEVILALWCDFDVVEWRSDLYAARRIDSIVVSYLDVPLLVAESLIRALEIPRAQRGAGTRVMFGKVFGFVEDATREIATRLNAIATTVHFAGRITEAVAFSLRGNDPALPKAPFAPLASAVNFVMPGTTEAPFTVTEALLIAPLVGEIVSALAKAPYVRVQSTREFADMYDVKRITAERTHASVMTIVTRRHAEERAPARMFDRLDMSEVGLTGIDPADSANDLPSLDATVDAALAMFSKGIIDEAFACFSDADARRALVSVADEEELTALAACIAGEIDYNTPEADPNASLNVKFLFRIDEQLAGWESLVITNIDGLGVTDDYRSVLRLVTPRDGSGTYQVSNALNDLLAGGKAVTVLGVLNDQYMSGGREFPLTVTYPVFTYDPVRGMTVTDKKETVEPVVLTPLTLLGLAPLKSHALAISPALRDRLSAVSAMFTAAYDLAHDDERNVDYVLVPTPDLEPTDRLLFKKDAIGDARRDAVQSQISLMYRDAIIRFLTSQPAKVAYSQAVIRARARAQKPSTALEAEAYLETVERYVAKFVVPLLGLDARFVEVYNALRQAPEFAKLAQFEILHPNRRG